jgi:excisionase family DNA binding protein
VAPSSTAPEVAVEEAPFLSVVKVAEILGVSQRQARQMVKDGTIPSFRLGQRVVVPCASLEGWEEEIDGQGLG